MEIFANSAEGRGDSSAVAHPARPYSLPSRIRAGLADATLQRGILSLLNQAICSVTTFATAILIGRTCTQAELGIYYLALTVIVVLSNLQGELITAPYTIYRSRRTPQALPAYEGSVVAHQIIFLVAAAGIIAGMMVAAFVGLLPVTLGPVLAVVLLGSPFILLRGFIRYKAFADMQLGLTVWIDAISSVVQLSGLFLLAYWSAASVPKIYVVVSVASAMGCWLWLRAMRGRFRLEWSAVKNDWLQNWGFARWALISQLVGCSTPYIVPWLVTLYRSEADTGVLAACQTLCGIATMFVLGIAHLLTPKAAEAYAHHGVPALRRVLFIAGALFVAAVGSFCLLVMITDDWLLRFVYGNQFSGYGTILALLAFSVLANSISVVQGNGMWAVDRPRANLPGDAATLLATLGAAFLLIEPYGVLGAAIAVLTGSILGAIVRSITLHHLLRTVSRDEQSQGGEA